MATGLMVGNPAAQGQGHGPADHVPQPDPEDSDSSDPEEDPKFTPKPTCVSIIRHEIAELKDLQAHIFGCLPYEQRTAAFAANNELWTKANELEKGETGQLQFLQNAADINTTNGGTSGGTTVKDGDRPTPRWLIAKRLTEERKRIRVLRGEIETDPRLHHLSTHLKASRKAWRKSATYRGYTAPAAVARRGPDSTTAAAAREGQQSDGPQSGIDARTKLGMKDREDSMLRWWLAYWTSQPAVGGQSSGAPAAAEQGHVREELKNPRQKLRDWMHGWQTWDGQPGSEPAGPHRYKYEAYRAKGLDADFGQKLQLVMDEKPDAAENDGDGPATEEVHQAGTTVAVKPYEARWLPKPPKPAPPEPYSVKRDVKTQLMALKSLGKTSLTVPDESVWIKDEEVKGLFPEQFMSLESLLGRDMGFRQKGGEQNRNGKDPQGSAREPAESKEKEEPHHIQYFHIPYTHMGVSSFP